MKRSNYVINSEDENQIVLKDLGPWDQYLTITNDAENIIEELSAEQKEKIIYYFDSNSVLTELLVLDGKLKGFRDV